ncbi:CLL_collapsed_G0003310.mRNA.1.CDS.1 [Saccharomyces cerevisiae]|uniref:RNA helicase n=1 Tax=Saccharomyces cerevisiae (strain Kyokai no. 7 / NBRC 101557) TaxID=721032 RepID=G2W9E5_YEASK|nr:Mak5p [Saccharomyces cerevisiae YJM1418]AJQ04337.1 Mak5p [Saccharomyces cerevisiae YJM456]KAF4001465.1 ATP-dependent RNA helicase MAK5 [Saccharomyces cerevisiae]GAA21688.1 K7_Mak5p [Saccharomyces cerevisiae Kyokai no. 7]CAD6599915.1 HLJ1_G0015600.mRNA.1.CDS.1 [Saccharomyces cerevisiae]
MGKKRAPQKGKTVTKPQEIIVDESKLNWKPVDIPDTLDDFGGFYGLEEIDGVDVKVVDGKVTFVTKKDSKVLKDSNKEKVGDDQESVENESGSDSESELLEFKNLDDIKEGELSAASYSSSDEDEQGNIESSKLTDPSEDVDEDVDEDVLKENVFNKDINIDDISPVNLPEWTNLAPLSMTILQSLQNLNFLRPTEIQKKSIPVIMQGVDVMGKASTGSGKTLAYGIPIVEKLISNFSQKNKKPISLIFTPTRELAHQVTDHLKKICEPVLAKSQYSILSLTGGLSIQKQQRLLKYDNSGQIVIATPGRFLELLEKDNTLIKRFSKVDTLILDEADRLLQDGHFDEFEKIIKHLLVERRKNRENSEGSSKIWQTLIFSATFSIDLFDKLSSSRQVKDRRFKNNEDELNAVIQHLMSKIHFNSKPVIIDTNPESKVSSQIKESLIECPPLERDLYCYYFLTMFPGTTLIFCNAIDSVKKLTVYLNNLGIPAFQIHSSMTQKNRLKSLERFKQQSAKQKTINHSNPDSVQLSTVLIASDVAARGLDIPGVQHVIHYHLPRSTDIYIHRSGRTARAGSEGVSAMICSPQESMGPLRKLRKTLATKNSVSTDLNSRSTNRKPIKWQNTVPLLPIETDILSQLRERSRLAGELADHEIASNSLRKDDNWLKKAADELGIDVDSDEDDISKSNSDTFLLKNKNKKMQKTINKDKVKAMRATLNELLSVPIRKDRRQKYLTGGLVNLADNLVKKRGHNSIIGHEKTNALETLKKKKKRNN